MSNVDYILLNCCGKYIGCWREKWNETKFPYNLVRWPTTTATATAVGAAVIIIIVVAIIVTSVPIDSISCSNKCVCAFQIDGHLLRNTRLACPKNESENTCTYRNCATVEIIFKWDFSDINKNNGANRPGLNFLRRRYIDQNTNCAHLHHIRSSM